jgi:hypothetical protein
MNELIEIFMRGGYKIWFNRTLKMNSMNIKTSQIKNLGRHRNSYINSKRNSTTFKVKQRRL